MNIKIKQKKGFTLIELLVVISIIGLLSSLALMGFSLSRQKSRDGKRYGDLSTLSKAIQIYQIDNNDSAYPAPNPDGGRFEYSSDDDGVFIEALVDEGYMGENIVDPINSDGEKYYFYGVFYPGEDLGGTVTPCEESWGQYYILGVTDLEGFLDTERPNPNNSPYTCGVFTAVQGYDYYIGNFGEK